MHIHVAKTKKLLSFLILSILCSTFVLILNIQQASAATTFTVTSTLDSSDNNPGDGICDDGLGNCTLRAAIEESNATTGTDNIDFNISEPADFTNNSQNGYTFKPQTSYPPITDQVNINGYSQPNAQANSATSPNPFNGTLLIEIDGEEVNDGVGVVSTGFFFSLGSDNSTIRGLVINMFTRDAISLRANNVSIQGNYLGSDPTGLVGRGNDWAGITSYYNSNVPDGGENALVGGLNPEDRNLIVDNHSAGAYPYTGWVIQGNYVGVDATGTQALGNSFVGGPGGMSIDHAANVLVGGTSPGATNVFSGNLNQGIAPDDTTDLTIQGNIIGLDYTGTQALGNGSIGINLNRSTGTIIGGNTTAARNIISANGSDGICFGDSSDVSIQGNYIGTDINGVNAFGNAGTGITTSCSTVNVSDVLIGGTNINEGNVIAFNNGTGILVAMPDDTHVSILGNSIHSNDGIGIDLNSDGVSLNDANDTDTGANGRLNFPLYQSVVESGGDTTVNFDLDVPAGDYRIEFYSNAVQDPLGYGEGEAYIGFTNITHTGSGTESFVHTLSGVTGVTNLAMTATEINSSPTGFGSTSEFGSSADVLLDFNIKKELVNPSNVQVGQNITYKLTLTNNGNVPVDFSLLDGSNPGANSIVLDIAPPEITFVSVSDPNVSCASYGPNSASLFGPVLGNHSTYTIINCGYIGSGHFLNYQESYVLYLTFNVAITSNLKFTNYAVAPILGADPDASDFTNAVINNLDIIDNTSSNNGNLARSVFEKLPVSNSNNEGNIVSPAILPITGLSGGPILLLAASLLSFGIGISCIISRRKWLCFSSLAK
ncbi:MAG: CSLREA domain-containing protein [Acidimicrobiia bacterium]